MKIRRKTEDYGLTAGIIEIELTDEELEQAYRERQHQYRLEDVRSSLSDAYESEQISKEVYEKIRENEDFHEAVLWEYDRRFSCNIPENVTWEESWRAALEGVENYAG